MSSNKGHNILNRLKNITDRIKKEKENKDPNVVYC